MTHSYKKKSFTAKLDRLPMKPGVYLMKDVAGNIIYVGKAQFLKKRVSSYFTKNGRLDIKTGVLVKKISSFETIITGTEKEALILEANLIKRYKPRYNIILKDDKRYPSLRIDIKHPYPHLAIVRKISNDDALYFGPFTSARAVRQTLKIINKAFKFRKCKTREFKNRTRPCLNYQMGACLAPCCLNVDPEKYREIVNEVVLVLKGRTPELIHQIKAKMKAAAGSQDFETAAMHRDKMYYLKKTLEKQVSVTTDFMDRDVLALARTEEMSVITLFAVRGGYLLGSRHIHVKETLSTDEEIMGAFIRHYYDRTPFVPKEILVSALPDDTALIENWLKNIKGQNVRVKNPKRGEKARLLGMASQNAENKLMETAAAATAEKELLERIQKKLKLKNIPERIECFDNSNISGTEAVAGMAVFIKGRPDKSLYRKFSIKTVRKHDDYAYMKEVLTRRYGNMSSRLPYPDLLLIDGGKGQLNIAVSVLTELQLTGMFEVVSIAKKDESKGEVADKIYKSGRVNPVNFGRDGDLLLFLQRVRDEAHRFAVSYHRQQRRATAIHSKLDTIPGIGKKRKAVMLKKFGSIKKIRAASIEEISALPGLNRKVAETVKKTLSG